MIKFYNKTEQYDISREEFASYRPFLEKKKAGETIDFKADIKCMANIIKSFFPEGYIVDTRYFSDGIMAERRNEIYLNISSPKGVKFSIKYAFRTTADILFLKLEVAIVKKNIIEGYLPTTLSDLKKCMLLVEDYALGNSSYNETFGDLFEEYYRENEEA